MTSVSARNGSSGFMIRVNSKAAPSAAGVHWFIVMPFGT